MKINLFGDKIIVRQLSDEEAASENASGIYVPNDDNKDHQAVIVQVGPKVENKDLKEGVKVLLTKMSLKEHYKTSATTSFTVIKEQDIIATIEDE